MLASWLACGSAAALRGSQQQTTLQHRPEAIDLMGDQDWTNSDPYVVCQPPWHLPAIPSEDQVCPV